MVNPVTLFTTIMPSINKGNTLALITKTEIYPTYILALIYRHWVRIRVAVWCRVAHIANTIGIIILLTWIKYSRAIIYQFIYTITVSVPVWRKITNVTLPIAISVSLTRVSIRRTVVGVIF